jgi:glycosyltransferase involved in cell wall biosynthesis
VDEKRFSHSQKTLSARQALGIELGFPVLGTVSSLNPHKGHTYLLEAATKVLEIFPTAQFLLVGDGRMKEELEIKAQNLNLLSSIKFLGIRKDIPEILAVIDIFVLPSSSREGLGISLLEAMAAEKPVVASDIGGIPEVVIDGETGFLVPPKNSHDLAGAIIELLKNPAKAALMGQQGRQRVKEKFTTQQMLENIDELYTSFLQKKK